MNILLLGGGGREHALAWKMASSPLVHQVLVLPGNDGMGLSSPSVRPLGGDMSDWDHVVRVARDENVAFVLVGPENPLAEGVADYLEGEGIPVVGPSKAAAKLESSKIFAKEFMEEFSIPTASYQAFTDYSQAQEAIRRWPTMAAATAWW